MGKMHRNDPVELCRAAVPCGAVREIGPNESGNFAGGIAREARGNDIADHNEPTV